MILVIFRPSLMMLCAKYIRGTLRKCFLQLKFLNCPSKNQKPYFFILYFYGPKTWCKGSSLPEQRPVPIWALYKPGWQCHGGSLPAPSRQGSSSPWKPSCPRYQGWQPFWQPHSRQDCHLCSSLHLLPSIVSVLAGVSLVSDTQPFINSQAYHCDIPDILVEAEESIAKV